MAVGGNDDTRHGFERNGLGEARRWPESVAVSAGAEGDDEVDDGARRGKRG